MSDMAAELRARARATWGAGNWDAVSNFLAPVTEIVLDHAEVASGMEILDVGCGSGGTIAIPAALRGATVTGVDVTPELFEAARRRAAEAGVDIDWREGDAAALPVEDASFDRVISTFGHAFAPDHAAAAHELVRACRPGGTIAAAMWTPDGFNGRMFATMARHMPPPPPGFQPPVLWGTEEHWRELFAAAPVELEFHHESVVFEHPDLDEYVADFEANFGPLVTARAILGDGFAAVHADLLALNAEANTATDGGVHVEAGYLVAVARRAA